MKKWIPAAAAFTLILPNAAHSQDTFHWPAPETAQTDGGRRFYLEAGTPIQLKTRTEISTRNNKPGDRVYLEVAEPVSFKGQTVIPIGAPVFAEVSRLQKNGHFGRKGKLEVRLLYVQTPSGPVRLDGSAYDEGVSGAVLSIGTFVLISPLGFLFRGTSGVIPPGTSIPARLANELRFTWYPPSEMPSTALRAATPDGREAPQPGFAALQR